MKQRKRVMYVDNKKFYEAIVEYHKQVQQAHEEGKEEPEILKTFIVCDSAETDKTYNDATVFSFFGIYKIKVKNVDIGLLGLHWIDCQELRVEPKDLKESFTIATSANEEGAANYIAERIDAHQKWGWKLSASLKSMVNN